MDPVINLEEKIGKTVGRRRAPDPLRVQEGDVLAAMEWRRGLGGIRVPRVRSNFTPTKKLTHG